MYLLNDRDPLFPEQVHVLGKVPFLIDDFTCRQKESPVLPVAVYADDMPPEAASIRPWDSEEFRKTIQTRLSGGSRGRKST